jgi:hypothetical protein
VWEVTHEGIHSFRSSPSPGFFTPVLLAAQEPVESQKITRKEHGGKQRRRDPCRTAGKGFFQLQCNKGYVGCTILEPGDYLMTRLPKNRGVYDCSNVEVYRNPADAAAGNKLGQYCLTDTK